MLTHDSKVTVHSCCMQQPHTKVLGVCSNVPLFTSCSRPNRSGFTEFFHLGTLLSSTGGRVWNRLWERKENLFMLLILIFLCQTALLFSRSQRASPLLVPVSWLRPEFSVDLSLNCSETAKIILAFIS